MIKSTTCQNAMLVWWTK